MIQNINTKPNTLISFGLNPHNRAIVNVWRDVTVKSSDRSNILTQLDMKDSDIKKLSRFLNSILKNPRSQTQDVNTAINKSVEIPENIRIFKKGYKSLLKRWSKLMLSVREKMTDLFDKHKISHPPVGQLSRSASGEQGMQVCQNISMANHYIQTHVEKGKCPDKEFLTKLHCILTEGLKYNDDESGKFYKSKHYSGIIRGSQQDKICSQKDETIEQKFDETLEWLKRNYNKDACEISAKVYKKLLSLTPFYDANGRTLRAFIDAILQSKGYKITFPSNFAELRANSKSEIAQIIRNNCTPM